MLEQVRLDKLVKTCVLCRDVTQQWEHIAYLLNFLCTANCCNLFLNVAGNLKPLQFIVCTLPRCDSSAKYSLLSVLAADIEARSSVWPDAC